MGQFIFGNINKDGTTYSGSGNFTVDHERNTGIYTISFNKSFQSIPTVVTLQNCPEWDDFSSDGYDTRDNTVLISVNREKCKVKTGGSAGTHGERNFGFIAVGD